MLDPNNPFGAPQPTGFEGLETFDPFGSTGISTNAAMYVPGCGGPILNNSCFD